MAEPRILMDVLDDPHLERAGWIKWVPSLLLVALVPILVGIAVFSRQPPTIWSATDIALFILTALLCTLVAVSLMLAGCGDWLRRMDHGSQTTVTQILAIQEAQARLIQTVEKSGTEITAQKGQVEKQQQLIQDAVTRLADGLQTVGANVAALSGALQSQKQTLDTALATWTGGQGEWTAEVQKVHALLETLAETVRQTSAAVTTIPGGQTALQEAITRLGEELTSLGARQAALSDALGDALQSREEAGTAAVSALTGGLRQVHELTQAIAGAVAGAAQEQSAAQGSLRETLTAATAALQQGQKTLQARVEKAAETDGQIVAAVNALTAGHAHLANDVRQLQDVSRTVADGMREVAREQAASHGTLQDRAQLIVAATEAVQRDQQALQAQVEKVAQTARETVTAVSTVAAEQTTNREAVRRMVGQAASAALAALAVGQGQLAATEPPLRVFAQPVAGSDLLEAAPSEPVEESGSPVRLAAAQAVIHGTQMKYESGPARDNLGYWSNPDDWAQWEFEVPQPGRFHVVAELAALAPGRFQILAGDAELAGTAPTTGDYGRFQTVALGAMELPTGKTNLAVRPIPEGWQPMNLRSLSLTPVAMV